MSSDDFYSLISDLLALPGRYSLDTLQAAKQHIRSTMRGDDRDALLRIVSTLESLVKHRESKNNRSLIPYGPTREDVEIHELAAILSDQEFLPTRSDLIALLNRTLKEDAPRLSSKLSRDAVIRKAMTAFSDLSPGRREKAFRSLRNRFIRARGSSLKDWSDIISE